MVVVVVVAWMDIKDNKRGHQDGKVQVGRRELRAWGLEPSGCG